MNESSNSSNDTIITKDRFYDKEYATFNYIMIGMSFGILLVFIVVVRILCICNKDNDYDQRQLLAERQISNKQLPQTLQPQTAVKAEIAGHSTNGHRIPGEVSPEANHRYRSFSTGRPMSGFSSNRSRVHGIWQTNSIEARGEELPRLDKITNTTSPNPTDSITSTTIRSDPSMHDKDQSVQPLTNKPPSIQDPLQEQQVLQENVSDFLQQLETMVNMDIDNRFHTPNVNN